MNVPFAVAEECGVEDDAQEEGPGWGRKVLEHCVIIGTVTDGIHGR